MAFLRKLSIDLRRAALCGRQVVPFLAAEKSWTIGPTGMAGEGAGGGATNTSWSGPDAAAAAVAVPDPPSPSTSMASSSTPVQKK